MSGRSPRGRSVCRGPFRATRISCLPGTTVLFAEDAQPIHPTRWVALARHSGTLLLLATVGALLGCRPRRLASGNLIPELACHRGLER
jgi:hypothetical protein